LQSAAIRQGVHITEITRSDLVTFVETNPELRVDRVLVDAPCTGFGVLARRPDLRWNRAEEDIQALTRLQDRLLDAAATLVRPGGVLVYSTCTVETEENGARVDAFLAMHPEFEIEPLEHLQEDIRTDSGTILTLPHVHGIDGGFVARMRRRK
jgi:16S rRNA (cytosine967-C5)-methyltransferase